MDKVLIAVLGQGKGTWGHVARIIADQEWNSIYLVSNEWGQEKFKPSKECQWIMTNNRMGFELLQKQIEEKLPEKADVHVSLISGTGKEHMALLAALKNKGVKYGFVVITGDGIKYF